MGTPGNQKEAILKRPRYDLHTSSSPPGQAVSHKVRTNIDTEAGPYSNWRLYNDFNPITGDEDTWPPENTVLQDWHIYHLLTHSTTNSRKARWPADFDSMGRIRLGRNPRGRSAKIQQPDGCWHYVVYRITYQLHGDEGHPKLQYQMLDQSKGSTYGDKNQTTFTAGQKARVQDDYIPTNDELLFGTMPGRFSMDEILPLPWKTPPPSETKKQPKEKRKMPEKKGSGQRCAPTASTTSTNDTPQTSEKLSTPKKQSQNSLRPPTIARPNTPSNAFAKTIEPIRMASRAFKSTAATDAQAATQQFLSREVATLLYEAREESSLIVAAIGAIANAIYEAAADPDEDSASALLTNAVNFSNYLAESFEGHQSRKKREVFSRLERSGLGKQMVQEYLTTLVNAFEDEEYAKDVTAPLQWPSLVDPEHAWDIKDKLEAMRAKKTDVEVKKAMEPLKKPIAQEKKTITKEDHTLAADKKTGGDPRDINGENACTAIDKGKPIENGKESDKHACAFVPKKRSADGELLNDRKGAGTAPVALMKTKGKQNEDASDSEGIIQVINNHAKTAASNLPKQMDSYAPDGEPTAAIVLKEAATNMAEDVAGPSSSLFLPPDAEEGTALASGEKLPQQTKIAESHEEELAKKETLIAYARTVVASQESMNLAKEKSKTPTLTRSKSKSKTPAPINGGGKCVVPSRAESKTHEAGADLEGNQSRKGTPCQVLVGNGPAEE